MKAKLIKVNDYYYLRESYKSDNDGSQCERTLGTTNSQGELGKLSKQNCDEIFGVTDVEKLALANADDYYKQHRLEWEAKKNGFIDGYNKAMELNKDKVFTLSNLRKAFNSLENHPNRTFTELVALLQPAEIEVEIEMEYIGECNGNDNNGCFQDSPGHNCGCFEYKPKLDSEGCLILKKI